MALNSFMHTTIYLAYGGKNKTIFIMLNPFWKLAEDP